MYYIENTGQTSSLPPKTIVSMLINTLTIPSQQRKLSDHQFVYEFFHSNKILCDIERLKSLNAKQQCIANLYIDTKKPEKNKQQQNVNDDKNKKMEPILIDQIVVIEEKDQKQQEKKRKKGKKEEKPQQTRYYILLDGNKKQQIMKADEKHLRRNLEKLKTFMILKDLKYEQLLHMAYYMDQVSYKYKEEVYREGQQPQFLYLVQKGQFQYSKMLVQPQGNILSMKKPKKQRPKRYDASKPDNPNRLKNSKSIQMIIGIIQGSTGQSFGVQEIIAELKRQGDPEQKVKRQYTVKCISTQNSVIRIPEDKYKKVISNSSATKMDWVKRENQRKLELKDEMLHKMIQVKSNYKKYTEIISNTNANSLNKTQQIRYQRQLQTSKNPIIAEPLTSNNKSILPRIKSQSMASDQHRIPPHLHQFLDRSRGKSKAQGQIDEYKDKEVTLTSKVRRSYESEQNQDGGTFDLTKAEVRRKNIPQREAVTLHINTNGSNASLLPTISSQKYKVSSVSAHDSLEGNVNKNWSNYKPLLELRGLRNKFSGMIDANSMIKQKQEILYSKLNGKQATNQVFSLEISQKKNNINRSLMNSNITPNVLSKQQARELRSAVHSKVFMQKLLVQALKKAGYNSQKKQDESYYMDDSPNSIVDIKNNLRVPKIKNKSRIQVQKDGSKGGLLHQNEFDECYFRKL